ncbi:acyltransferase family protein [Paenibacillus sp. CF384]|uniref:acyltransferase family protein n=1 Tax=Paenibacillus sp. CF384 TaxID=1884382 RepID=UPI000894E1C3|nr:acyltransferase family protein [Paenibacillus sp. CF384]SDW10554.1 Peptidoglycan/LPS O-acetylase OafA/YrhL, contains acyltransferase and SGNH-hydrolase domains [Paenibacillus sp. CF384]
MNKVRINYLDVYRAIAILAVLMIHITSSVVTNLPMSSSLFPLYVAINSAAHYAVPAFLFLSALVLFYNYDGQIGIRWGNFYGKRILGIIVPYVIWSFLYYLLMNEISRRSIKESWPKFFEGLLFGSNYAHLYYIVVLLQLFLLFPLLLRLIRIPWIRSYLIPIGILAQLGFYFSNHYLFHMGKPNAFIGSYFLYLFLGAHSGIKLSSTMNWLRKPKGLLYGAILLLGINHVVQIFVQLYDPLDAKYSWFIYMKYVSVHGYATVCCYFLIHISAMLHAKKWGVTKLLKELGVASFGIYLIHPFILNFWRSKVMTNDPLMYHLLIWAGGLAALMIPWVATMIFRRFKWGGLFIGMDKVKVVKSNANKRIGDTVMKVLQSLVVLLILLMPINLGETLHVSSAEGLESLHSSYAMDNLLIRMGSQIMIHNGETYKSVQPVSATNGNAFIPLSAIALRYHFQLVYNAQKKEATVKSDRHELGFKAGSSFASRDGSLVKLNAAPYISKGYLMVPLRSWGEMTDSTIQVTGNQIMMKWSTTPISQKPKANFEVSPVEIYAGQTKVTYLDLTTSETGQPILNERWEGQMEVFPAEGTYVIKREVQDTDGVWSDPFYVKVKVQAPNQPPVADFAMDKPQYRIGESVTYTNTSTDDKNAIVRSTFTGNDPVFFEPGEKLVTLVVEDKQGLTSTVTKTITVTNNVLYTKDEYARLFTPTGDIYAIDAQSVLNYPSYKYRIDSDNAQMVRSNSPEMLIQEGIEYRAQLTGKVRFMFHNINKMGYPVTIHLLATNTGSSVVNYNKSASGIGGPTPSPELAGKLSTARYLTSLASSPAEEWSIIRPGETKEILPDISKASLKPGEALSSYIDAYSDKEILYNVVVIAAGKEPIASLPNLSVMPRDGVHVRGTFYYADRSINIEDQLGDTPQRIMFGDIGGVDTILDGIDETTGQLEYNRGNYGVLYRLHLSHVSPHTLISLNGRGGIYTGAFFVKGKLVMVANNQALRSNTQAAVLHRTGESEESVNIIFTIASGSNLPIAMTLTPLPPARQ